MYASSSFTLRKRGINPQLLECSFFYQVQFDTQATHSALTPHMCTHTYIYTSIYMHTPPNACVYHEIFRIILEKVRSPGSSEPRAHLL